MPRYLGASIALHRIQARIITAEVDVIVGPSRGWVWAISTHRIEPAKGYWRNTRRDPGRWPGSPQTD